MTSDIVINKSLILISIINNTLVFGFVLASVGYHLYVKISRKTEEEKPGEATTLLRHI